MQTYEEILKRMYDKYEEKTETRPDRASDIGVRMEVLAGEIFSAQTEIYWLKNQMFPHTATGEYLDMHALQRGLTRKQGTKAVGEVEFYLPEILSYDVEVPEGTICATSGENPVRFVTTESVTIKSGRLATLAPVEALTVGESGNVVAKEINVMVTPVAGIDKVVNDYKMTDGSDIESDEQLRARVLESYVNIPNGTNKAFYIKSALEVEGVSAVGVIPKNRGVGTVDVFIMSQSGEPSQSLLDKVQAHLSELREINVDVEVKALRKSGVNVYAYLGIKKGYDFEEVKENCIASVKEYFSLLSAGETVYLSDMGQYIAKVEGVLNYTFMRNFADDVEIRGDCVAVPALFYLEERSEG